MDLTTFFTETLLTIANESILKMSPSIKKSKPWFDTECRKAVKIRRATLKAFKKQPAKENLNTFKNCRAKARQIFKEAKRRTWRQYISKINKKQNYMGNDKENIWQK